MSSISNISTNIIHTEQIDIKKLWDDALVSIELSITSANFKTWFRDTQIVSVEDGTVTLGVPSVFVRDWVADKFQTLILKTLRDLTPHARSIEYAVVQRTDRKQESSRKQTVNAALPLEEYYINKSDNLNPKYVFDNFVVGPFNELAHAAARTVVNKPGIAYNPLFIYGKTGHGKTHLIQAVGNQLKRVGKKVFYVTSERFTVDYMNALQNGTANGFKDKYRQYDVLVMDDVQFLMNKEKTQEELFHLFNSMHDNNKQIVFSSDVHPAIMSNMEDRLRSRFAQGMIVDIPEPDFESRGAILRSKAAQNSLTLSDDVVEHLSHTIDGNVREIEGALNTILCQSQLLGRTLNLDEVKVLIKNSTRPRKSLAVSDVVDKVARYFDIDPASIYEKTRRKEVVKPRQLIMYILREDFQVSYPAIGQKLGGRDHTTVIHSCEKIKHEVKESAELEEEISQIRLLLK
ncbi:chromosomal replication initiator protein DnaA [Candidatus Kaiserbacteria bacterium]|nr:MAG: chromosomal replication initiator protein DnaA [Candidatus Kaiserbacteria bacterium]